MSPAICSEQSPCGGVITRATRMPDSILEGGDPPQALRQKGPPLLGRARARGLFENMVIPVDHQRQAVRALAEEQRAAAGCAAPVSMGTMAIATW